MPFSGVAAEGGLLFASRVQQNGAPTKIEKMKTMKRFLLPHIAMLAGAAFRLTGASTIEISQSGIWENQPFAFTVVRRGDTNVAVSFAYATTTNGTARAGVDFLPMSSRLVFAPGETSKEIVPLLDNSEINALDNYRSVQVWLSNPSPGVTLVVTNGLAFFNDNETPVNLDLAFAPDFGRSPALSAVVVQPDDRILLAGRDLFLGGQQVSLVRLNADGSFDTSFSSRPTAGREISHVALASDGKIVVAGNSPGGAYFISRLMPSGEEDPTFRVAGEVNGVPIVHPDGRIVLWNSQGLRRLNADGSADANFNRNTSAVIAGRHLLIIALLADGRLLAMWHDGSGTNVLCRLNPMAHVTLVSLARRCRISRAFRKNSFSRFRMADSSLEFQTTQARITSVSTLMEHSMGAFVGQPFPVWVGRSPRGRDIFITALAG